VSYEGQLTTTTTTTSSSGAELAAAVTAVVQALNSGQCSNAGLAATARELAQHYCVPLLSAIHLLRHMGAMKRFKKQVGSAIICSAQLIDLLPGRTM
jgi:hypothetical protein